MFDIIIANEGIWFNLLIPFLIGGYLFFNHKEYALHEFLAQVVLTAGVLYGTYFLFFQKTTNLYSVNYYNGWVHHFEHYDDYTETHHYTDSKGRSRTSTTYHPDEYYAVTTTKHQIPIDVSNWEYAKTRFGRGSNGLFSNTVVMSQSWGGSTEFSVPNIQIPATKPEEEINYVKATANNIVKAQTFESDIQRGIAKGTLLPYPELKCTPYGNIRIDRIMGNYKGVYSPLQTKMDVMASTLGARKEVNPLIYVVDGENRDFAYILKSYWGNGGKNDAILVLGMKDNVVEWSETIAWTKNIDFLVNQTKIYKGMKLDENLIDKFGAQINAYFVRTPMSEFKYLEDEISLSGWAQFAIVLLNLIGSFFLFRYFLEN